MYSTTQRKRALYFSFTLLKQLASKKRPDLSRNCKQKATRSASVTDDQSALSSDEKILHLIVLCSNLQILFAETHALKMSNLNLRRFARAKQCRYFSRRRGWGIVKGEGSSFASALPRNCKQSVIQAPSPLTKSLARNTKFYLIKFGIFKMRIWADKFENLPPKFHTLVFTATRATPPKP